MSQASKRPGSRDISDLKARLGLKKKPAAGAKPGAVTPPAGMAPPPGAAPPGAIPPPPGAAPPQPAAPVIPDAQDDPFGAMNAMAAHSAATAAPQIVVVNDGQAVEQVGSKGNGLRIAKLVGIVLLPLILGIAMGKIGQAAGSYNKSIADASAIKDDLDVLGKSLVALQQMLQIAQERGPGGNSFKMNDTELTKELDEFKLVYANPELAYGAHLHNLSHELITDLLSVYSETIIVYRMVKDHVEQSKGAEKVFDAAKAKMQKFGSSPYAAHLQIPSEEDAANGKPISVRIVQLGPPICEKGGNPNPAGCGGKPPVGFGYRLSELSASWGTKSLAKAQGELVESNRLVFLDPNTKVFQQLITGGKASTAEVAYMERINALNERLTQLIDLRKNVAARFNNKSNESTKFDFFIGGGQESAGGGGEDGEEGEEH